MLDIFIKGYDIRSMALTLAAILFISGCVNHQMTAREMIADMNKINSSPRADINILWYKGSDVEFEYFGYVYGMTGSKNYKVPVGDFILPRVDITDDESKWVRIKEVAGVWSASQRYQGQWEPDRTGMTIRLEVKDNTAHPK